MKTLVVALMCVAALAGCADAQKKRIKMEERQMAQECPTNLVQQVSAMQMAINDMRPGKTNINEMKKLPAPLRTVSLTHPDGGHKSVRFYATGVPTCRFMYRGRMITPVIVNDDGVVADYGVNAMHDLAAKGWKIPEATWGWLTYNYSYLPSK